MPPLSNLLIAAAMICLIILCTKSSSQLFTSIVMVAVCMSLSRFTDFGHVAVTAKACVGACFLVISTVASKREQKNYNCLSITILYLFGVLYSLCAVLSAEDANIAAMVRVEWLALVVAAIIVSRTLSSRESFDDLLTGLFFGLSVAVIISLWALVTSRAQSFSSYGRFHPYGCNPNQLAVTLCVETVASLYIVAKRKGWIRSLAAVMASLSVAIICLTMSRFGILAILIGSSPCLIFLAKTPMKAFALVSLCSLASYQIILDVVQYLVNDRLWNSSTGNRFIYAAEFFRSCEERIITGLLGTNGIYVYDNNLNSHNVWMEMLHIGGLVYVIPVVLLNILAFPRLISALTSGHYLGLSSLQFKVLASLYLVSLLSQFVNTTTHFPTYPLAFLHVICGFWLISARSEAVVSQGVVPDGKQLQGFDCSSLIRANLNSNRNAKCS